jgi:hypothetical protein
MRANAATALGTDLTGGQNDARNRNYALEMTQWPARRQPTEAVVARTVMDDWQVRGVWSGWRPRRGS